ncbi:AraC family transcriptional regulator [Pseudonocardia alaniniphila]|uniref:AraC family transcriptional regulator n=1 Tax=Pseudonocardia alaniniphila TaxID=75291 RepID=A0ABS9TAU8_9PSEU|nr:AraC family transcriptional regulator [Pseudonocardia alaniniphila]MCH6165670.1 AraC family transcriptional regulator [Pseudonocardia alaniniphila]
MSGAALPAPMYEQSAVGRLLVSTRSVEEAEARGTQLLSPHRLKVSRGAINARIRGVSLGTVALYHLNYAAGLTVTAPPMDGYIDTLLPLRGVVRVDHDGARFDAIAPRNAAVISPHASMTLDWSPDLSLTMLRVEAPALRSFARLLTGRDDTDPRLAVCVHTPDGVAGLHGLAHLIRLTATQFAGLDAWPAAITTRLREQAMLALLLSQPDVRSLMAQEVRGGAARTAVQAAVALVDSRPTEHFTTARLAREVGVSVRTLQFGFRAERDTTPQAYLLRARLSGARADLLAARTLDGATVAGIARRWGFSNVGRFAEQYRRAHGERPHRPSAAPDHAPPACRGRRVPARGRRPRAELRRRAFLGQRADDDRRTVRRGDASEDARRHPPSVRRPSRRWRR